MYYDVPEFRMDIPNNILYYCLLLLIYRWRQVLLKIYSRHILLQNN